MRGHKSVLKGMSGTDKSLSILNQMSMKFHSKLGSFLRIKTKVLKSLHAVRAANGATHSQKNSVEANVGGSLAKMFDTVRVLLLSGLKLAPRPGIFAVLDFNEMDVPLIGHELTRVPEPG